MLYEIKITEMPGSEETARIGSIKVSPGDEVKSGDILLSLESGKIAIDVESTESGIIKEILVNDGDEVKLDTLLVTIEGAEKEEETEEDCGGVKVLLEELPTGVEKGIITSIFVFPGEEVKVGDVLCYIEGSKVHEEVLAPYSGKIVSINFSEGDDVNVGDCLFLIEREESDIPVVCSEREDCEECAEVVVLGGGTGGYVAAIRARQNGRSVILIEEDTLGGTCLNRGCIPTKSMVQSVKVNDLIKNAEVFGIEDSTGKVSMKKIIDRKNKVVGTLVGGLESSMKHHSIKVIRGHGILKDKNTIEVETPNERVKVTGDYLILAPGSVVSYPPIKGMDLPDLLTSDELLELEEIPESMIILGGRVIAMEFAFIYRKLGTKVKVIQRSDTIFPNLDDDVIEVIRKSAIDQGIELYEGYNTVEVINNLDDTKTVIVEKNGEEAYLTADYVAVATGRGPNIENIGLEEVGIEISEKYRGIKVNDKMETNIDNIYAIGDATNIYNLAHVASKQGIIAANNIEDAGEEMDYMSVPEAVFTDPEIGLVGYNEKMLKAENIPYVVGKFPYLFNGKSLVENVTEGFIKVLARKDDRKIVGAALVGLAGSDLLATITNLVKLGATIDEAKDVIYAHPTVSEALFEAILDLDDESIHLL